jgi:hypothetical protein
MAGGAKVPKASFSLPTEVLGEGWLHLDFPLEDLCHYEPDL